MEQIFTVSGSARHGKDTFAKFALEQFAKKYNKRSLIVHHADYLKYIATTYLGWNGVKDETGRYILQHLGTEAVREGLKKPTYWVEKTCDVIEICWDTYDYIFVPDTRFRNEIYYMKARFPDIVHTVEVVRLDFDNGLTIAQSSHVSETDLKSFPFDTYLPIDNGISSAQKKAIDFADFYSRFREDL